VGWLLPQYRQPLRNAGKPAATLTPPQSNLKMGAPDGHKGDIFFNARPNPFRDGHTGPTQFGLPALAGVGANHRAR
jgi:hypothetical protein